MASELGAFGATVCVIDLPISSIAGKLLRYQLFHAIALIVVMVGFCTPGRYAAICGGYLLSIALFSGSIYLLVLGSASWLGPITPLGRLILMAGWGCVIYAGLSLQS